MEKYRLIYSWPYLDARDLCPAFEQREVYYSAQNDKAAIRAIRKHLPKTELEHNGETYKCQAIQLWRSVSI